MQCMIVPQRSHAYHTASLFEGPEEGRDGLQIPFHSPYFAHIQGFQLRQIMPQIPLSVPSFNDHIPFAVIKSHFPSEKKGNFPFYPFSILLFGSSRNALNLLSKLWIVTWVKEGVFRSSQSSKVQLIIESRTKTSEKPKNGLFTSCPSLETKFSSIEIEAI